MAASKEQILEAISNMTIMEVVDLVKMKALIWRDEELGAKWDEVDIPADQIKFLREKLAGRVIERIRVHRLHNRDVVRDRGEVRQQFGNFQPAPTTADEATAG